MSSYHGNVEAHAMPSGTSMHGDATGGPLSGLLPKLSGAQMWPSTRKLEKPSDHVPVGVDLDL